MRKTTGRGRAQAVVAIAVIMLCLVWSSQALVPQPLCIFYGMAEDDFGWPYLSDAEVFLRVNGVDKASYEVDGMIAPGVNFILRVPLDSGVGSPYSGVAVTNGAGIEVVVVAHDVERTIMQTNGLPPVGHPGDIIYLNVTAGNDSDGDGLPDHLEQWIIDYSWGDSVTNLSDVTPGGDFDGDGSPNEEEFKTGTDPAWDIDYFYAEELEVVAADCLRITLLTVPGKTYRMQYTEDQLEGPWVDCLFSTTELDMYDTAYVFGDGYTMSFYVERADSRRIFRLSVE